VTDRVPTPLEALDVLASQELALDVQGGLRHLELYCSTGLLTVLWHGPTEATRAVVAGGGALGGLLGPDAGLYHHLGTTLAADGVATLRVSYRRPNDLDACTLDMAAAVQLAVGSGANEVVTMGHSFGGAVAIRTAVALPEMVVGVVTFATQSAGCEVAGGLAGRRLLSFHGDRDRILPPDASAIVHEIAGDEVDKQLVFLPGVDHAMTGAGSRLLDETMTWLTATWS
jgi:alpha/beta superfamily hydrolase